MSGDDGAVNVLDVTKDFGDRFAAVVAWRVPESDRYPEYHVVDALRERRR